jgi:hypothetical protein
MALNLAPCFSWVVFPVAAAMGNVLELMPWFVEQGIGFGPALDRAGFAAPRPIRDLIQGNHSQQIGD